MHLKRNVQKEIDDEEQKKNSTNAQQIGSLSTKEGRVRVYSCVFCEFVQSNLDDIDEDTQTGSINDGAFEAKYLYHMRTVHGLDR